MSISGAPDPSAASPTPSSSSSIAHLITTHLPTSPLVPRLTALSSTLLSHKIAKETQRQVEQLRGEMTDRWRSEAWKVKASWMAGMVPTHQGDDAVEGSGQENDGVDADSDAEADGPLLQPTIMSDADGAAEMSRRVDDKVESGMSEQMKVAEEVILDGFTSGAGDEDQAAKFVLERLEDALFEAGLSPDNTK